MPPPPPPHEAARPKALPDPRKPTPAEVREHELTHLPYRSWCRHCVRGKGKNAPHRELQAEQEHEIPHVSADYCFFGQNEETSLPAVSYTHLTLPTKA